MSSETPNDSTTLQTHHSTTPHSPIPPIPQHQGYFIPLVTPNQFNPPNFKQTISPVYSQPYVTNPPAYYASYQPVVQRVVPRSSHPYITYPVVAPPKVIQKRSSPSKKAISSNQTGRDEFSVSRLTTVSVRDLETVALDEFPLVGGGEERAASEELSPIKRRVEDQMGCPGKLMNVEVEAGAASPEKREISPEKKVTVRKEGEVKSARIDWDSSGADAGRMRGREKEGEKKVEEVKDSARKIEKMVEVKKAETKADEAKITGKMVHVKKANDKKPNEPEKGKRRSRRRSKDDLELTVKPEPDASIAKSLNKKFDSKKPKTKHPKKPDSKSVPVSKIQENASETVDMTPLTCIHCLNAFLSPAKLAYHIDTSHAQIEVLALYKGRLCVMRRASGTCRCGDRECGGEYECAVCEYTAGNRRTLKIHLGKKHDCQVDVDEAVAAKKKVWRETGRLAVGVAEKSKEGVDASPRRRGRGGDVESSPKSLRRTQSVVDNGEEGEASSKPLRRTRVIAVEEVVEVKEKTIRFDEGGEGIGVDIAVKRTWTQDVEEVVKVGGEENGEDAKLSIRTISMEPVEKMEMDEEGEEEEEEEESEVARLLKRTRSRSKEISEEIKPLRRTRSTIGDEEVAEVRPVKRRGRSSLIDEEVQSRKRAIVDEPVAKRTRGREVGSLPRTRSGVIVSPKKKVMGKMEDDKSPASRRGKAETVVLTAKTEVVEKFYEETSSGEVDINFVGGNDISTDRESPESLTADSAPDENNDSPTSMDMDYGSVVSRPASLAGVAVAAISEMMTPWVKSIGKMVGWAKGGLRRVLGGRVEKKKVGVKSATTVL